MGLCIYNTALRKKEAFEPLNPPRVGLYACGVTVYDDCHIGHARAIVIFDMIYRYLSCRGYEVTYVRNFTDVDDKIIKRANEEGIDCREIAERYIQRFNEDIPRLNVRAPSVEPRATENIQMMQKMIAGLIEKGHAYEADGNVFYAIDTFVRYGKLSRRTPDEMVVGARGEQSEGKRNPMDFALWKKAKTNEPSWESPWGRGRPGWHIECSAMSLRYLGEIFDIHGGGSDLIFPHHENEIAQSEGYTGRPHVRYWIHNGHVTIDKEKMSKSLGNFFTLRDIYREFDPRCVRLYLLSSHYRSPLDFSTKNLEDATEALRRLDTCVGQAERLAAPSPSGSSDQGKHREKFESAMNDDFNTPAAMAVIFDLMREVNVAIGNGKNTQAGEGYRTLVALCDVLGIELKPEKATLRTSETVGAKTPAEAGCSLEKLLAKETVTREEMQILLDYRNTARQNKDWKTSDLIRDKFQSLGYQVRDGKEGTEIY